MKDFVVTVSRTGICIVNAESQDEAMLSVEQNPTAHVIQWDNWSCVTDAAEVQKE